MRRPIGKFLIEYFAVKNRILMGEQTVLAAVVISFPLMYRSARGAFGAGNHDVLSAGRTLGLSEWNIFWKVQMPIAWQELFPEQFLHLPEDLESLEQQQ